MMAKIAALGLFLVASSLYAQTAPECEKLGETKCAARKDCVVEQPSGKCHTRKVPPPAEATPAPTKATQEPTDESSDDQAN